MPNSSAIAITKHPGVILRFVFYQQDLDPVIVWQKLKQRIISLPQYQLDDEKQPSYLECSWKSPGCGWVDQVRLTINKEFNDVIVVGESHSTNAMPSWCFFKIGWTGYSDHGMNEKHLRELMNGTGMKFEAKLIKRVGK